MPPPPAHTQDLVRSLGGTHFRSEGDSPEREDGLGRGACHTWPCAGARPTVPLLSGLKEPAIQAFQSWTKIVLLLFSTLI